MAEAGSERRALLESALYVGRVTHARTSPREHRFSYRTTFLYLDLDELPGLFEGRLLWSFERANIACFRRADYLGSKDVPLSEAVRSQVEHQTGKRPTGPIRLLTQVRRLGWVFNPVSFYYCFDEAGEKVQAIVAEITNTPWNERHSYVLDFTQEAASRNLDKDPKALGKGEFSFDKSFHVSPFFGMDQRYSWRFSSPEERLGVWMRNLEGGKQVFAATLELERRNWNGRSLCKALVKHPLASVGVWLAIHWQAARLWAKRTPFFTHPAKL